MYLIPCKHLIKKQYNPLVFRLVKITERIYDYIHNFIIYNFMVCFYNCSLH